MGDIQMRKASQNMKFYKELEDLINRYSMENESNTPDFILAHYLIGCLRAFNAAVGERSAWYGYGKKGQNINAGQIFNDIEVFKYEECDEFSTPVINQLLKWLKKED